MEQSKNKNMKKKRVKNENYGVGEANGPQKRRRYRISCLTQYLFLLDWKFSLRALVNQLEYNIVCLLRCGSVFVLRRCVVVFSLFRSHTLSLSSLSVSPSLSFSLSRWLWRVCEHKHCYERARSGRIVFIVCQNDRKMIRMSAVILFVYETENNKKKWDIWERERGRERGTQ